MFKKLLPILLLFNLSALFAQPTDSLSKLNVRQPLLIIKWAPLSLVDLDNTVQFGVEYFFKFPVSIQQEIGYGWFNFNANTDMSGNSYKEREVWRSRSEIRFYFENKYVQKPKGAYLALELLYKRINYSRPGNVGRECDDFECEYFETMDYKILKDVYGFHGKVGGQFLIRNRFALDIYLGGGLRRLLVKSPGLPADENNFGEEFAFIIAGPTEPGNYTLLSMSTGFKVGYLIYKRK